MSAGEEVRLASTLVLVAALVAGCLGVNDAPARPTSPPSPTPDLLPASLAAVPAANASAPPPVVAPRIQTFDGHLVVGGAYEPPAHFTATEKAADPVWRSGVMLTMSEMPQDMQLSVDWNGTGTVELMTFSPEPNDTSKEVRMYETGFTSVQHQCVRIPADEMEVGDWDIMVHAFDGAAITFKVTVTTVGGNATLRTGPDAPPRGSDSPVGVVHELTYRPRQARACDEGV